jgi:glycosyltransferase involved in cell wall biosynthesis
MILETDVSEKIIVTGFVDRNKALSYLKCIDIFVISSFHDGCPNSMLEAMLAERAIIATNVDGMRDVLTHNQNAILVNPDSHQELLEALYKLINEPAIRQKLGVAAKKRALRDFNLNIEAEIWRNLYQYFI